MKYTNISITDLNKRLKELNWLEPHELTARVFEDVTGMSPNYIMVHILKGDYVAATFFVQKSKPKET